MQHSGTVRAADQFVPGATVTATQNETKVKTFTDESGHYSMDLSPGVWEIQVEMFGFPTVHQTVTVGDQPSVRNWALEMARLGQGAADATGVSPEITGAANGLQTDRAPEAVIPRVATMPAAAPGRSSKPSVRGRRDNRQLKRRLSQLSSGLKDFRTPQSRLRKTASWPWPMRPTQPPAAFRIYPRALKQMKLSWLKEAPALDWPSPAMRKPGVNAMPAGAD